MSTFEIDIVRALRDDEYRLEISEELEGYGVSDLRYDAADEIERLRAAPKVKPLVWDVDGRRLRLDDTINMGKGYDWDGYEIMRQEGYGLGCGYIIWPDSIGSKVFSLYGAVDGLYVQGLAGEDDAKAAAKADYERRILSALE